jgi:cellulose synthase/poly-beta-1,6-N-acetylglucosamine synthase-like glycosyltransferase
MHDVMETIFWISALVIGYVYAGYPLLLAIWARLAGRPPRKRTLDSLEPWPTISLILAARNEASRLPARVSNLLSLNYDGPREIIVVSDGSADGTAEVLQPFAGRIRLIELPAGGKPLALNAGAAAARGEILVFADARQWFEPDALRELVANFADVEVGGVTGELVLDCESSPDRSASTIGDGVSVYWKYEKWLRRNEGLVRSTLGATGAIYALRRSLWRPLPAETLLDDVLAPMRAVLAGYRVVFDERARACDTAAPDSAAEVRRKRRTLAGNYQILALEPRLLIPFVNPVWLQYVSHKLGRLIVPWTLLPVFITSALLATAHWVYAVAFAAQTGFYGLAALGAWYEARDRRELNGAKVATHVPRVTHG